jgi:hypothetical protein
MGHAVQIEFFRYMPERPHGEVIPEFRPVRELDGA